jgi:hypothetical protein
MRVALGIVAGVASLAWAVSAFAYAALTHIDGPGDTSNIIGGVAATACGVVSLLMAFRAATHRRAATAAVLLVVAAVSFALWLEIAVGPHAAVVSFAY